MFTALTARGFTGEPEGGPGPLLCSLQFREDSPDVTGDSSDGGWSDGSGMGAGRAHELNGRKENMDETKIRENIQKKLQSGLLPQDKGSLIVGGSGGSGQSCSACDETIKPSDMTPIGYEYPSRQRHWFHCRCEEIWQEERHKIRPRN